MLLITAVLLIAGFYVGWNLGANDSANCIGTSVGSGILSYRRAVILVAVFVILGSVLQGQQVIKTVGKGIVEAKLPDLAIFIALVSGGVWVMLATFLGIPVSTSQSVVGGVLGVGIARFGMRPEYISYGVLKKIVVCWALCPILTGILSLVIYFTLITLLRRVKRQAIWTRIIAILAVGSACYVSYSLGANNIGNAIGPLFNKYPDKGLLLALLGSCGIAVGALTFGRRVTETVGKNITPLDLPGAFAAQFAAAFGLHIFSIVGIPVSASQAIVGAVVGIGLVKGIRSVRRRQIIQITIGWFATPTFAAIFSFFLYRLLSLVFA